MKRILLIATGGTIASKQSEEGLTPLLQPNDILQYVPSILEFCNVDCMQPINLDSTNMAPDHWLMIAHEIEKNYDTYDGFVVLHGTDTMSYTAAALSYLIQNSVKPIVITGSQRPVDREITDAILNIKDSFLYACDDQSWGVSIVFQGKVIVGTRARKTRTKSFNAFSSMDFPSLAVIRNDRIIRYIRQNHKEREVHFYHDLNTKVFLLKLIPGMNPKALSFIEHEYDAIIIESFGLGGLPNYHDNELEQVVKRWIELGKVVLMTTQVPYEGSDMSVYQVGLQYKEKYGLLESYDMTLEATVTKLMWALAEAGNDQKKLEELYYNPVNYDVIG
ncbi:L-asparaginase I, cytoplasmic [Lachnospiraceae bacterium KM106-2]|nr:L-asparaginase I, cytoplasmic [Lachnospiraceae bacterium KM106-2]